MAGSVRNAKPWEPLQDYQLFLLWSFAVSDMHQMQVIQHRKAQIAGMYSKIQLRRRYCTSYYLLELVRVRHQWIHFGKGLE